MPGLNPNSKYFQVLNFSSVHSSCGVLYRNTTQLLFLFRFFHAPVQLSLPTLFSEGSPQVIAVSLEQFQKKLDALLPGTSPFRNLAPILIPIEHTEISTSRCPGRLPNLGREKGNDFVARSFSGRSETTALAMICCCCICRCNNSSCNCC